VTSGQVHGDKVELGSHAGAGVQALGLAELEPIVLWALLKQALEAHGSANRLWAGRGWRPQVRLIMAVKAY